MRQQVRAKERCNPVSKVWAKAEDGTSNSRPAPVHRARKASSRLRMCKARPELAVEDKKPKRFSLTMSRPQGDLPEAAQQQLALPRVALSSAKAKAKARNINRKLLLSRVRNNQESV